MNENELMHYGVPGMKWGIRRDRDNGSTLTSAGKNKEYKKALRTDKKIRRNLESNAYDSARFANAYSKKSKSYSKKYEKAISKDPTKLNLNLPIFYLFIFPFFFFNHFIFLALFWRIIFSSF